MHASLRLNFCKAHSQAEPQPACLYACISWAELLQLLKHKLKLELTISSLPCRVDRPRVLLASAAVNAVIVLGLTLIKRPQDIW